MYAETTPSSSISLNPEIVRPIPKAASKEITAHDGKRRNAAFLRDAPLKTAVGNMENSQEGIRQKEHQEVIKIYLFDKPAVCTNNKNNCEENAERPVR